MTRLKPHQKDAVRSLNTEQVRVVHRDLTVVYPDFPKTEEPPTAELLVDLLAARRIDHAGLLRPMFRETSPVAVGAMEHLIGKPFTRPQPKIKHAATTFNGRAPRARPADNRIISCIVPNPKKPGSASYDRFAKYRENMTVSEALAAGVTMADIKWDSERGFICLT